MAVGTTALTGNEGSGSTALSQRRVTLPAE
jgi:hypothetical protein